VIGIVIDHDVIAIPIPIAAVTHIVGRNRKEEAAEPEAPRAASAQSPHMAATNTSREMAVLPRMIHAIMLVAASGIVSYPPVILGVNMRGLWMAALVGKGAPLRSGSSSMRSRAQRSRAVGWDMPTAYPAFPAALVWLSSALVVLREQRNGKQQNC